MLIIPFKSRNACFVQAMFARCDIRGEYTVCGTRELRLIQHEMKSKATINKYPYEFNSLNCKSIRDKTKQRVIFLLQ